MAVNTSRWLAHVPGNLRLNQIVIPGSHDAGVYKDVVDTRGSPASFAVCQNEDFRKQASAGSRMFDCRVFLRKVNGVVQPTMGHFFHEGFKLRGRTGNVGAYGGTLLACINDAVEFVKANGTEFIILRFSHTKCVTEVGRALKQFLDQNDRRKHIYCVSGSIAKKEVRELRGRVIMVFDSKFHNNFQEGDGYLRFAKFKEGVATTTGLCTCGEFKGSAGISGVVEQTRKNLTAHAAHAGDNCDHLCFVYWQQTMTLGLGNIENATLAPNSQARFDQSERLIRGEVPYSGGAHANLPIFIREVREKMAAGEWKIPNIISHDFVNDATCTQIIELNACMDPGVRRPALPPRPVQQVRHAVAPIGNRGPLS